MSGPGPEWLQDPDDPTKERWWDGEAWTDLRRNRVEESTTPKTKNRAARFFLVLVWTLVIALPLGGIAASYFAWTRAQEAETHFDELSEQLSTLETMRGTLPADWESAEDAKNG